MLDPCQSSSNNWKLISFGTTWLHPKLVLKKKKSFPLSFSPSLASLYLFEQWLRLGVTSTSSVWLPLQDESLYVFPNCKSLWIKASAKWLNVNVNVNVNASCLWGCKFLLKEKNNLIYIEIKFYIETIDIYSTNAALSGCFIIIIINIISLLRQKS